MNNDNYDDIINLPHHVSKVHKPMSLYDRAVQFSPFAALVGYEAQIAEKGRLTVEKIETDEGRQAHIDMYLQLLNENADEHPEITVIYFKADEKKDGGSYEKIIGGFKRIDESDYTLVFTQGVKIPISDIFEINGEFFNDYETDKDYGFFE